MNNVQMVEQCSNGSFYRANAQKIGYTLSHGYNYQHSIPHDAREINFQIHLSLGCFMTCNLFVMKHM